MEKLGSQRHRQGRLTAEQHTWLVKVTYLRSNCFQSSTRQCQTAAGCHCVECNLGLFLSASLNEIPLFTVTIADRIIGNDYDLCTETARFQKCFARKSQMVCIHLICLSVYITDVLDVQWICDSNHNNHTILQSLITTIIAHGNMICNLNCLHRHRKRHTCLHLSPYTLYAVKCKYFANNLKLKIDLF